MMYTTYMRLWMIMVALLFMVTPDTHARIPTPDQVAVQQNQVYGTYTGPASTWNQPGADPFMASRGFGASNSYQQFGQMQRQQNMFSLGISLLDVFTSQGTFGQKVKFLLMDQLNRRVNQPFNQFMGQASQNLTFDQLYRLSQGNRPMMPNQSYSQCVGCVDMPRAAWQPTYQNPHSLGGALNQPQGNTPNTSNDFGGVVSPR